MKNEKKMHTINRIFISGTFLLLLCTGCNDDYSRNPENMLGGWTSLQGRSNVTISKDKLEYFAIVHHRITGGKECPVRYPIVYSDNSTYIKAGLRIIMVYSKKDQTLFLSPGGEYCHPPSK